MRKRCIQPTFFLTCTKHFNNKKQTKYKIINALCWNKELTQSLQIPGHFLPQMDLHSQKWKQKMRKSGGDFADTAWSAGECYLCVKDTGSFSGHNKQQVTIWKIKILLLAQKQILFASWCCRIIMRYYYYLNLYRK